MCIRDRAWAARAREFAGVLPPTDREIDTQLTRAYDADTAPVLSLIHI